MSTTPIIEARQPPPRLALVSLVAALSAAVGYPLRACSSQRALQHSFEQALPGVREHARG